MGGWRLPKSKWANPYKPGKDGTIDEVLEKYKEHILSQPVLIQALPELKGKILGCWCKKKGHELCHGDVLVQLLENV